MPGMSRWKRDAASLAVSGLVFVAAPAAANESNDHFEISALMDRYGTVHDFGSPEEYADLFTSDGEMGFGGRVLIKGRDALMAQATRDHEKYSIEIRGQKTSLMRHIISNKVVNLTGKDTAEGSSFVMTYVQDGEEGPKLLSIGRYEDQFRREGGAWKIAHRNIVIDFGDQALAKKLGFR